jgi:hypothetical protein
MIRWVASLCSLALVLSLPLGCKKQPSPPDAAAKAPAVAAAPAPSPAAPPEKVTPAPAPVPQAPVLADPLLKALPKKTAAVFLFPTPERTGRLLRIHLERHAEALEIQGKVDEVMKMAGLGLANIFDPGARARWGIDGGRSAAVALAPDGRGAALVLTVTSFEAFEAELRKQLQSQEVSEFTVQTTEAGKVTIAKRRGKHQLAYAQKGAHVFVVPSDEGGDPKAALEVFLKTSPTESLVTAPTFVAAASKLGSFEDALLFFDGDGLFGLQTARGAVGEEEKRSLRRLYDVLKAVAVGIGLTEKDLRAELYVSLSEAAQWASVFTAGADFPLGRFVDSGAMITVKATVDGPGFLEKILDLDPGTRTQLAAFSTNLEKRLGIHLERDLFRNLSGRVAAALVGMEPDLVQVATDPRRRAETLFQLHAVAAAELKNPDALRKAIQTAQEHLKRRAPDSKLSLAERSHAGTLCYELIYEKRPMLTFAVVEGVLLAAVGKGRLEKTLDLAAGKAGKSLLQEIEAEAKTALTAPNNAAVYANLGAILAGLRGLNLRSLGKRGAETRAVIDTNLSALLSKLKDLIAEGRFDGQGVRLQALLRGR